MAFPSVTSWLDGTFENRLAPSTVYLFSMKNHPGFYKLGIQQLTTRKMRLRAGDPEYGAPLWESCMDAEIVEEIGDIPLGDCWLFEQYVLALNIGHVEQIPSLA